MPELGPTAGCLRRQTESIHQVGRQGVFPNAGCPPQRIEIRDTNRSGARLLGPGHAIGAIGSSGYVSQQLACARGAVVVGGSTISSQLNSHKVFREFHATSGRQRETHGFSGYGHKVLSPEDAHRMVLQEYPHFNRHLLHEEGTGNSPMELALRGGVVHRLECLRWTRGGASRHSLQTHQVYVQTCTGAKDSDWRLTLPVSPPRLRVARPAGCIVNELLSGRGQYGVYAARSEDRRLVLGARSRGLQVPDHGGMPGVPDGQPVEPLLAQSCWELDVPERNSWEPVARYGDREMAGMFTVDNRLAMFIEPLKALIARRRHLGGFRCKQVSGRVVQLQFELGAVTVIHSHVASIAHYVGAPVETGGEATSLAQPWKVQEQSASGSLQHMHVPEQRGSFVLVDSASYSAGLYALAEVIGIVEANVAHMPDPGSAARRQQRGFLTLPLLKQAIAVSSGPQADMFCQEVAVNVAARCWMARTNMPRPMWDRVSKVVDVVGSMVVVCSKDSYWCMAAGTAELSMQKIYSQGWKEWTDAMEVRGGLAVERVMGGTGETLPLGPAPKYERRLVPTYSAIGAVLRLGKTEAGAILVREGSIGRHTAYKKGKVVVIAGMAAYHVLQCIPMPHPGCGGWYAGIIQWLYTMALELAKPPRMRKRLGPPDIRYQGRGGVELGTDEAESQSTVVVGVISGLMLAGQMDGSQVGESVLSVVARSGNDTSTNDDRGRWVKAALSAVGISIGLNSERECVCFAANPATEWVQAGVDEWISFAEPMGITGEDVVAGTDSAVIVEKFVGGKVYDTEIFIAQLHPTGLQDVFSELCLECT